MFPLDQKNIICYKFEINVWQRIKLAESSMILYLGQLRRYFRSSGNCISDLPLIWFRFLFFPFQRAVMAMVITRARRNGCAPPSPRSSCKCCRPTSRLTVIRMARIWSGSPRWPVSASVWRKYGSRTRGRVRKNTYMLVRIKVSSGLVPHASSQSLSNPQILL